MKAFLLALLIRKAQEPTTWAGILSFLAGAFNFKIPKDVNDALIDVLLALVSLCLILANESREPSGGPLGIAKPSKAAGDAPPGSVRVVPPTGDVVRTVEAHTAGVPSVQGRDLHSDARPVVPAGTPKPVRPGFDRE